MLDDFYSLRKQEQRQDVLYKKVYKGFKNVEQEEIEEYALMYYGSGTFKALLANELIELYAHFDNVNNEREQEIAEKTQIQESLKSENYLERIKKRIFGKE